MAGISEMEMTPRIGMKTVINEKILRHLSNLQGNLTLSTQDAGRINAGIISVDPGLRLSQVLQLEQSFSLTIHEYNHALSRIVIISHDKKWRR